MDQDDIKMDGARMPRSKLIEKIEYEANAVSSGISTDFLIQMISREAIDEIQKSFEAANKIPDRASRIAMLTILKRMASCMQRISLNDEVDYVGPRMIARSLRLSGLILLNVEQKLKGLDDENLRRYWDRAKDNYNLADHLHSSISIMLDAEQGAEAQEQSATDRGHDEFFPKHPRRCLLDVLFGRHPEVHLDPR